MEDYVFMSRRAVTFIGKGEPAIVLEEFQRRWPGLDVTFRSDDISRPTDWRIHDPRHSIVVHLGGRMHRLETELDGSGGSCGPAQPGEVWTAPAGRRYASHACGGTIHYAVLSLDPGALSFFLDTATGQIDIGARAGVRDAFLHHAVLRLMAVVKDSSDVSRMLAESLIRTMGLHILGTYSSGDALRSPIPVRDPRLDVRQARLLRMFIHEHLSDRILLDDLAALVGMTTHHLLIAFRHAFGSTPAQHIIQQRLRHAQQLLLHTRKDITTIALESGFSSHSHMTACFNQHLGCSPSAWRSQLGKRG